MSQQWCLCNYSHCQKEAAKVHHYRFNTAYSRDVFVPQSPTSVARFMVQDYPKLDGATNNMLTSILDSLAPDHLKWQHHSLVNSLSLCIKVTAAIVMQKLCVVCLALQCNHLISAHYTVIVGLTMARRRKHLSIHFKAQSSESHHCPRLYWLLRAGGAAQTPDPLIPRGHPEPQPRLVRVWVKDLTARLLRLHLGPWIKHQLGRRAPCLKAWGTKNWGQLTRAQSIQTLLCSQLRGHITVGGSKGMIKRLGLIWHQAHGVLFTRNHGDWRGGALSLAMIAVIIS